VFVVHFNILYLEGLRTEKEETIRIANTLAETKTGYFPHRSQVNYCLA